MSSMPFPIILMINILLWTVMVVVMTPIMVLYALAAGLQRLLRSGWNQVVLAEHHVFPRPPRHKHQ